MKVIAQLRSCTWGRLVKLLEIYLVEFCDTPHAAYSVFAKSQKVMYGAQCKTRTFPWNKSILKKKKIKSLNEGILH